MRIGVVIPTVPGREAMLARCRAAYRSLSPPSTHIIVQRGYGSCGAAWAAGAAWCLRHDVDVLHFTADDLMPHEGWHYEALGYLRSERSPGCVLMDEDGGVWNPHEQHHGDRVQFPRVPLLLREWWEAMPPIPSLHYYSDCWIGDRLDELGIRTEVCTTYRFTHSWAQAGRHRDDTADRLLYEGTKR